MVDALISNLTFEFGNELDGIYLYGSVARGDARPNDSDLDVTLIFKTHLTDIQRQRIEKLRLALQECHSEITKVDFDIGLFSDVLDPKNKYLWGYWIKHCCKCIWGSDLSPHFPLFKPSTAIALAMAGDCQKVTEDYAAEILSQRDNKDIPRLKREASRKLVRSTIILREHDDASWPITLEDYYHAFCSAYPHERNELDYLLRQAKTPDSEIHMFIQRIRSFSAWLGAAQNMRQPL